MVLNKAEKLCTNQKNFHNHNVKSIKYVQIIRIAIAEVDAFEEKFSCQSLLERKEVV
jgi:hypothetical protein